MNNEQNSPDEIKENSEVRENAQTAETGEALENAATAEAAKVAENAATANTAEVAENAAVVQEKVVAEDVPSAETGEALENTSTAKAAEAAENAATAKTAEVAENAAVVQEKVVAEDVTSAQAEKASEEAPSVADTEKAAEEAPSVAVIENMNAAPELDVVAAVTPVPTPPVINAVGGAPDMSASFTRGVNVGQTAATPQEAELPDEKKTCKKKGLFIALAIILVLALSAVLLARPLKNLFLSDFDRYKQTESNMLTGDDSLLGRVSKHLDFQGFTTSLQFDKNVEIKTDDKSLDTVLNKIKDKIKLTATSASDNKDGKSKFVFGIGNSEKTALSINLDINDKGVILSAPELLEKRFFIPAETVKAALAEVAEQDQDVDMSASNALFEIAKNAEKIYANFNTLSKNLLDIYMTYAKENFTCDRNETIEVDDVRQDGVTVYKVALNGEQTRELLTKEIAYLEKSPEVEKIITELKPLLQSENSNDPVKAFKQELKRILEDKKSIAELPIEGLLRKLYVSDGKVVGQSFILKITPDEMCVTEAKDEEDKKTGEVGFSSLTAIDKNRKGKTEIRISAYEGTYDVNGAYVVNSMMSEATDILFKSEFTVANGVSDGKYNIDFVANGEPLMSLIHGEFKDFAMQRFDVLDVPTGDISLLLGDEADNLKIMSFTQIAKGHINGSLKIVSDDISLPLVYSLGTLQKGDVKFAEPQDTDVRIENFDTFTQNAGKYFDETVVIKLFGILQDLGIDFSSLLK